MNKNALRIERTGRASPNVMGNLDLRAVYRDEVYDFSKVTGILPDAIVIHFARQGTPVNNGLNTILLMTNGHGNYRAMGLSGYDGSGKPQFFRIGDDLEITVEKPAAQVIREIPQRLDVH